MNSRAVGDYMLDSGIEAVLNSIHASVLSSWLKSFEKLWAPYS